MNWMDSQGSHILLLSTAIAIIEALLSCSVHLLLLLRYNIIDERRSAQWIT